MARTLALILLFVTSAAMGQPATPPPPPKTQDTSAAIFLDEPAAHKLYDRMVEVMRMTYSLSFKSHYVWEAGGDTLGDCTYRTWLKKPNFFRVETESSTHERGGILIGDGDTLWIYWPGGRPRFNDEKCEVYEKTRLNSYMKERAPLAHHSIAHETGYLGVGMSGTILDLSTFHGYDDALQPYIDGVQSQGVETVRGAICDKIEVSFMKHQRSWYLWLARSDHLPRKLKEIVRVSHDINVYEEWLSVTLNAAVPDEKFAWRPPAGWQEYKLPAAEESLLKPGTKAPDFELLLSDGRKVKLSNYRGRVVWLYIWRAG